MSRQATIRIKLDVTAFQRAAEQVAAAMKSITEASAVVSERMAALRAAFQPARQPQRHVDVDAMFPGHLVNRAEDCWPFAAGSGVSR